MTEPRAELIHVFRDADALAAGTAAWLVQNAFARPATINVCLAGGSTPRRLYQVLAADFAGAIPWSRTHWFFGDERFVPQDHADSNFRMVRETLFATPAASTLNVHAVPFACHTPSTAAAAYEADLRRHYGADRIDPAKPVFDATLLGLGEDGHIASLFPGTPALDVSDRWAVALEGVKPEPRISLTYPVLEASGKVAFLVSGSAKREILGRVWRGDDLPAVRLHPSGEVHWFIDRAADPR